MSLLLVGVEQAVVAGWLALVDHVLVVDGAALW